MKVVLRGVLFGVVLLGTFVFWPKSVGAGTRLRFSPNTLNFKKTKFLGVGETPPSSPKTISISNSGPAVTGLNIQISGSDRGDFQKFQQSTTCTTDLDTGANCLVAVTFTPTRSGKRIATLTISDDSNLNAGAVKLTGLAVETHQVITPPEVDFGNVQVGTTSPPKTVTIKNPNKISVNIESISTSGPPFAVSKTTCGSSLGAGKSCKVFLTFAPVEIGPQFGGLTVTTDAAVIPVTTNLTGTAVQNPQDKPFIMPRFSNNMTIHPPPIEGGLEPTTTDNPFAFNAAFGIAVDARGNFYLPNASANSIEIFAACASGTVMPVASISGSRTGLQSPQNVVLDSNANIYVTNFAGGPAFNGSVNVYPPLGSSTGSLDEAPTAIISGLRGGPDKTGLAGPVGIALDSRREIYIANAGSAAGSVTIYPPIGSNTGTLDEAPIATITGPNTGLVSTIGVALDSSDRIYVTNAPLAGEGFDSVMMYPPLESSIGTLDESPTATIAGADTFLDIPFGIALDSSGSIYVMNLAGGPFGNGSVTVYPPLRISMGILDERPTTTISLLDIVKFLENIAGGQFCDEPWR